jgi:hypothetical protein
MLVLDEIQQSWIVRGEPVNLFSTVAAQQCDRDAAAVSRDQLPGRSAVYPSPKLCGEVAICGHGSTITCHRLLPVEAGLRLATALVFVWLGMVVAISFIEAPLKFRAPGVTLPIGLGIGRIVFRALNGCELVFAVIIALALFTHSTTLALDVVLTVAIGGLFFQTVLLRPMLSRRTAAVLAGQDGERSGAHYAYVAIEVVKVIALIIAGVLLIRG